MSVLTRTVSPGFTNGGTWTTIPVSSVAGLTCALAGGALDAGRGIEDLQIDGRRQLDAHRFAAVELDLDGHLGLDVVDGPAQHLARDVHLLVGGCVHETKGGAILVQVLHLVLVERGPVERVLRAQLLVRHRSVANVAQLHAHEATKVAGGNVLQLEHSQ